MWITSKRPVIRPELQKSLYSTMRRQDHTTSDSSTGHSSRTVDEVQAITILIQEAQSNRRSIMISSTSWAQVLALRIGGHSLRLRLDLFLGRAITILCLFLGLQVSLSALTRTENTVLSDGPDDDVREFRMGELETALLMASLQASLRSQALHAHSDLAALIGDVDRLVYATSPDHLYASLFYAEYDTTTRLLGYVNAGHNSPLVLRWRDGQCKLSRLKPGGNPIGMLKGLKFISDQIQLEVGDVLVAYTDGITEAENVQGELWGYRRLENLLRTCHNDKPEKIIRCILDKVAAFTGGGSQRDDVTLMAIGVKAEPI